MPNKPYKKPNRRRMDKFGLEEISFVPTPAQEPALAAIIKSGDFDEAVKKASVDDLLSDDVWYTSIAKQLPSMRNDESRENFMRRFMSDEAAREQFPNENDRIEAARSRMEKMGDLVALQTSVDMEHSHGISLYETDGKIAIIVHFSRSGNEELGPHDHQVVMNEDGTYSLTTNLGHTHNVDQEQMRNAVLAQMTKCLDDFEKQEPNRETRERLAREGLASSDGSFPIRNRTDLRNAIQAFGRGRMDDRREIARHIQRRARALGETEMLPTEGVLADLLKSVVKEMDDLKKALAEIERLKKVASLSDVEKTFYDNLQDKEADAFLNKSVDDRKTDINKSAEANPVVYTASNGTVYLKSDDPRLVEMAKRDDARELEINKMRAERADEVLTNRAEEFTFIKGDLATRKALLKAIDAIEDDKMRNSALDSLKAANKTNEPAFTVYGKSSVAADPETRDEAVQQLDKLAKAKQAESGFKGNYYDAYDLVKNENPEIYAKTRAK